MKTEKPHVECECGAIINGKSVVHAESLMAMHVISKRHKELMEIKKRREVHEKKI